MFSTVFDLAKSALLALPPETAHEASLRALEAGVYPRPSGRNPASLAQTVFGLTFVNPIGVAAGFDKDARVPDAILGVGCGFAEVGTITPLAQSGNPQPRVFRLPEQRAIINRLGFNNGGHAAALARLKARSKTGIVAVNIGANKDTADKPADYVKGIDAFYGVASYFVVNISSPNTPGLRDLQAPAALDALLSRVMAARAAHVEKGEPRRPIVVKIAPDIAEDDLPAIVERLVAHQVDGVAVSNTTLARPGLAGNATATEAGGLSGRPLFHRSTVVLARVHQLTGGTIPLIGIGGIDSGASALAKIEAGATLVQLYTGLIYAGVGLIGEIKRELAEAVQREKVASVSALVGRRAAEWAAKSIEG